MPAGIWNVVANLALPVYRSWAIVDGYRAARGSRARGGRAGRAVVAVLLAVTVATHGLVAYVGWNGHDLITAVFNPGGGDGPAWGDDATPTPLPSATPMDTAGATAGPTLAPTAAPTPSPTPSPTPRDLPYWVADGRLNLLLLGGDAGPGRSSIRTDTMILLTVDLATARAALVSIPRNLEKVPLPEPYAAKFPGGTFPDLLNALWRWADEHPAGLPGNKETRGFRAVSATIGHLTGVEIDALAYVDLNGFVRVIDALGGLEIDVPYRVYDARYPNEDGNGTRVLDIRPGLQRLDGSTTLAFARSRHQDSDYGRIERQQLVLLALRRQVNPCTLLPRLPEMVAIAKESMYTNIPLEDLPLLLALAVEIDTSRIERLAFTPALGYPSTVTSASLAKMRRAVRDVFEGDPPPPDGAPDLSLLSC